MKRIILFLAILCAFNSLIFAQAPQSFKYQAVARDATGTPYTDANLGLRITLIQDGPSGVIDYSETHDVTTTDLGIFTLNIGEGTPITGSFTAINWGMHQYYLKVDIDPMGGTSFIHMGTSKLLSVPYALYAAESGSGGIDDDADPTNELQTLTLSGTEISISDGNNIDLSGIIPPGGTDDQTISLSGTTLSIESGNSVDLSSVQDGVNDADADPNNELQNLSFDATSNQLTISNGNTVTIPSGGTDADPDPTNELQNLSLSGTELSISDGNSLDLSGIIPPGGTDDQTISLSGTTLSIEDGNSVDLSSVQDGVNDADSDPNNEFQNLNLSGTQVTISNGNTIDLAPIIPPGGTDDQTLNLSGTNLSIENGNTIDLSIVQDGVNDADNDPTNEVQSLSLSGTQITISGSNTIDLNPIIPPGGSDDQNLSLSGTNLSIEDGNTIDLSIVQDGVIDADSNPSNEIQTLSKAGNTISLSNGGGSVTDEVDDADNNPNNEIQSITKSGNTVTLSNGGGSFTDEVDDADNNPNNEIQSITKSGNTVTLSNGGGSFTDEVDDADNNPNNEIQNLSLSGNTINLSNGGGSVTIPSTSFWEASGNDIYNNNSGYVGIGTDSPEAALEVKGDPTKIILNGSQFNYATTEYRIKETTSGGVTNIEEFDIEGVDFGGSSAMNFTFSEFSLPGGGLVHHLFQLRPLVAGGGHQAKVFGQLNAYEGLFDNYVGVGEDHPTLGKFYLRTDLGSGPLTDIRFRLNYEDYVAGAVFRNMVDFYPFGSITGGELTDIQGELRANHAEFIDNDGYANDVVYAGSTFAGYGFHADITGTAAVAGHGNGTTIGIEGWSGSGPGGQFSSGSGPALVTDDGFVGIGTTTPSQDFHVAGNSRMDGFLEFFGGSTSVGYITAPSSGTVFNLGTTVTGIPFRINQGLYSRIYIANTGNIGIGTEDVGSYKTKISHGTFGFNLENSTSEDDWEFWVNGTAGHLQLFQNGVLRGQFDPSSGAYLALSDKNTKTNIRQLPNVLNSVMKLPASQYEYKENNPSNRKSIGFLAQDVQQLFPELVHENQGERETGLLTVDYSGFGVLAIKAVQEQQQIIEKQQDKIEELEDRLLRLEQLLLKAKDEKQ